MDETYMGTIALWAGINYVPENWMACQGQLLPINQYQALYSLLGIAYGGDGKVNFGLPDLRGAVPVGVGVSPYSGTTYTVGMKGGKETTTLGINNLPPHAHAFGAPVSVNLTATLKASSQQGVSSQPTSQYNTLAAPFDDLNSNPISGYNSQQPDTPLNMALAATGTATVTGNTNPTGSGLPVNNMQPFVGLNYIICINGLYPPHP